VALFILVNRGFLWKIPPLRIVCKNHARPFDDKKGSL
jgi:hypothetical protein